MAGGKRDGAGRRPIYEGGRLQRVTVTLPREYIEWAESEGRGKGVSAGLRRLLDELDQRQGASGQGPAGQEA